MGRIKDSPEVGLVVVPIALEDLIVVAFGDRTARLSKPNKG